MLISTMPVLSTKMSCAKGWQHQGSANWSSRVAKVGLLEVCVEEDYRGKHTMSEELAHKMHTVTML